MPTLHNYKTGELIREATQEELRASIEAAKRDGGSGVILADETAYYVTE